MSCISRLNRLAVSLTLTTTTLHVAALEAQTLRTLQPGQVIRVTLRPNAEWTGGSVSGERTQGTFVALVGDSVRFQPEWSSPPPVTVALPWVKEMQARGPRRSAAGPGFLVGFGLGMLLGLTSSCSERELFCLTGPAAGAVGGLVYGGLGALIGAVAGRREWHAVPLDSVRAALL